MLDSSFAKAAPVYDDIPRSAKDVKATPVKEKDKKRRKSDAKSPAQPTPTVGPVAPSLKMKQNTAMAMALIAPTPRAGKIFYAKLGKLYKLLSCWPLILVGVISLYQLYK